MKTVFLTIATILTLTVNSYASNIIIGELAVISSDRVELTLETVEQKQFILSSKYDDVYENLGLTFESQVQIIQIFNKDGGIEMLIPIDSKVINLGLSMFDSGKYKMGFVIEGIEETQFTSLVIK